MPASRAAFSIASLLCPVRTAAGQFRRLGPLSQPLDEWFPDIGAFPFSNENTRWPFASAVQIRQVAGGDNARQKPLDLGAPEHGRQALKKFIEFIVHGVVPFPMR